MRVNSIVKQNLQSDFKSWEVYQSILLQSNLNGFFNCEWSTNVDRVP